MIQETFQHRSGRVIALSRLVLAAVFLVAFYIDPSQPVQRPAIAYALLAGYVIWSVGLLALTWTNWWLDFRLAALAHLIDIGAFGSLVFFTEGYTSPFYIFFVFLLLSSAIRWSWRETAFTAVAVAVLFFVAGTAALAVGSGQFDLQRLLIRLTHLIVLSLLFIWFGVNQQGGVSGGGSIRPEPQPDAEAPPIKLALQYALERMKAERAVLAWWHKEEPWIHVVELEGGAFRSTRTGPEEYGPFFSTPAGSKAFLFDQARGRALAARPREPHRLEAFEQKLQPEFAARYHLDEGVVIRVRCDDYVGELFALGIDGLCSDDLRTARSAGKEISALFDHSSMLADSEEAAFSRARMSLSRDLHDSVVQVIAGASFRLEALKSWIKGGKDPNPEIEAVKADLVAEQRHIRSFIATLRSGRGSMKQTDLAAGLGNVVEQIERRWNLTCEIMPPNSEIVAPLWIEHELHQIIREAAANAARHGHATALSIALRDGDGDLELSVTDNGTGAPSAGSDGKVPSPWSVHERVKGLGGSLSLFTGSGGSRLQVRVPLDGVT